jgi:hypothetical protein
VHRLQGEAERVKPSELLDLLSEFYVEKTGLKWRHEEGARSVAKYDFNNTYQYVIAREDSHLDWLRRAISDLGGALPDPPRAAAPPVPAGQGAEHQAAILADDARLLAASVERWRPRVEQVQDSRQKLMLRVVLGEMLEQKRFFDQAVAGRSDLLGRRTSPSEAAGTVLPTRWVE